MRLFYDHRGVVTVLVTILLIPSLLLTGFMVDLARIKCYQSQAVMAADSYANSVLSNYDSLLKDLYGLFAVTGDEEALEALDVLAALSFNPDNPDYVADSRFANLDELFGVSQSGVTDGFAPYANGTVAFGYTPIGDLSSSVVLSNQITAYMKFRGPVMLTSSIFSGAEEDVNTSNFVQLVESLESTDEDAKTIELKNEIDEAAEACINNIYQFAILMVGAENIGTVAGTEFEEGDATYLGILASGNSYYEDMMNDLIIYSEIRNDLQEKSYNELSDDEKELLVKATLLYDCIYNGSDSASPVIEWNGEKTSGRVYDVKASDAGETYGFMLSLLKSGDINISGSEIQMNQIYFSIVNGKMNEYANALSDQITVIKTKKAELEAHINTLPTDSATYQFAQAVLQEVNDYSEELIELDLRDAAGRITDSVTDVGGYLYTDSGGGTTDVSRVKNAFDLNIASLPDSDSLKESLIAYNNLSWFSDYYYLSKEEPELYNLIMKVFASRFGDGEKTDEEEDAENKQDEANNDLEELLAVDAGSVKIPDAIWKEFDEQNGKVPKNSFLAMIKDAGNTISSLSMETCLNDFVNYTLVMQYDLSMFSCATTDHWYDETGKSGILSGDEREETITGQIMAETSYLYQGELEYIYAVQQSASACQSSFMWQLAGVRGAMNFASTYRIEEINSAITNLAGSANALFPGLGLVVSGALRIAVAAIETVQEIKILKAGGDVVFFKNDISQLESYQKLSAWLNLPEKKEDKKALSFSYKDYLSIFIICFVPYETIMTRTGHLIELNMTYAKNGYQRNFTELNFRLADAVTMIEANCTVKIDPVFVSMGMDRLTDKSDEVQSYFSRGYNYSVIRGY